MTVWVRVIETIQKWVLDFNGQDTAYIIALSQAHLLLSGE